MNNVEQLKQLITLELENARMWSALLLPGIVLDMTLLFTEHFYADNPAARYSFAAYLLIAVLFVFFVRNLHITKARDLIKKLQ